MGVHVFEEDVSQTEADLQIQRTNEGLWGRGVGMGGRRYKPLGVRKVTRMHCATRGILPIFGNHCERSISFEKCINILKHFFVKKIFAKRLIMINPHGKKPQG